MQNKPLEKSELTKEKLLQSPWIMERMRSVALARSGQASKHFSEDDRFTIIHDCILQQFKKISPVEFKPIYEEIITEIIAGKHDDTEAKDVDLTVTDTDGFDQDETSNKCVTEDNNTENSAAFPPFSIGASYMDDPPDQKWIVQNLIEPGQIIGIAAAGGVGKTFLALDLGLNVSSSVPGKFYDFCIPQQCLVFLVTAEDSMKAIQRRLNVLDPDRSLRMKSQHTFFIYPVIEAFDGNFTLVEYGQNGKYQISAQCKKLYEKIKRQVDLHKNMPVVVIFDTYSATHHTDENTTTGATEWFRTVNLLIKHFNAAVIVMHHIRKTAHNEPLRTPNDFLMAIRGSNAFTNSCRRVFGIWFIKDSEAKKLGLNKVQIFNFSNLKDNNYTDWSDRDIGAYNRPTTTLVRHESGYLKYDAAVNEKRKALYASKEALSEDEENELQTHIQEIIVICANAGYPLSKSIFDKQEGYADIFSPRFRKLPPKVIKSTIQTLIDDGYIVTANIKINNKACEVYDAPDGDYAQGRSDKRRCSQPPHLTFEDD